jgi:hypothetical protein
MSTVIFTAEPINPKWRAMLVLQDQHTGEPIPVWKCEHSHTSLNDAHSCSRTQLEHLIEMVKP